MNKVPQGSLLRQFVEGHTDQAPSSLWANNDILYSYLLPIAKRERGEDGKVLRVSLLKGSWSSKTTQTHRRKLKEACLGAGIEFSGKV